MAILPSQHPNLDEVAYQYLREKIIEGELPPGTRLKEEGLINMVGISKTPIKLALARLEQAGLVKTIPRRGSYVIELTAELAVEVYTLKEVLEGLAARLAAQSMTPEDIDYLKRILSTISNMETTTPESYTESDASFHGSILEASGHRLLQEAIKPLFDIIAMFRSRITFVSDRRKRGYEEHMRILKAIEDRDPERAEQSMRLHLRRAMEDVLLCIDQGPWTKDPSEYRSDEGVRTGSRPRDRRIS